MIASTHRKSATDVAMTPTGPRHAEGIFIDPPVSVPNANGAAPIETDTAEPPLEPPADRIRSNGLRTGPKVRLFDVTPNASSCRFALPFIPAPAASSFRTTPASTIGVDPLSTLDPPLVGRPAVSMLSLI